MKEIGQRSQQLFVPEPLNIEPQDSRLGEQCRDLFNGVDGMLSDRFRGIDKSVDPGGWFRLVDIEGSRAGSGLGTFLGKQGTLLGDEAMWTLILRTSETAETRKCTAAGSKRNRYPFHSQTA